MILLSFYFSEKQHHADMLLYDWLLAEAKSIGIQGGSAFRAIAGFGRHGHMHEDTFFELAGELAVKVEFILDEALADKLLEKVRGQNMKLFHVRQSLLSGGV